MAETECPGVDSQLFLFFYFYWLLASSTLFSLPQSCPAIQVYSAKNLDSALTQAACSFCSQEVIFDPTQKRVTLSKIFVWYSSDFGDTENDVLR